jgi:hypothetical protein
MSVGERRARVLSVLSFPVALSAGILLIPVVSDYSDHAAAAEAVGSTGRWFAGHLLSAVAFGLSVLAVSVVAAASADRSHRLPPFVLPMIAAGAGLYAAGLGADGIGPVALVSSGASPELFFDGSGRWVSGVFAAATLLFGAGLVALALHVIRAQFIRGASRYVVFVAAVLFLAIPAIPSGWALYGEALAAYGVFVPLAAAVGRLPDLRIEPAPSNAQDEA